MLQNKSAISEGIWYSIKNTLELQRPVTREYSEKNLEKRVILDIETCYIERYISEHILDKRRQNNYKKVIIRNQFTA